MNLLKLTKHADGAAIYINPEHIIDVLAVQGGAQLTTTGISGNGSSKVVVVKENLAVVLDGLQGLSYSGSTQR